MADDRKEKEKKRLIFDKSLGTAAGLSKLLPTGTTLAFQTMAPSFTNGGECDDHDVNFAFTWGLIAFLTLVCALLSFTDSVTDKLGRTYYGVATPWGFKPFNHHLRDLLPQLSESSRQGPQRRMKWKWQDWLHAVMSAAVFVALAFCDAGVQRCLVPNESKPWHDFLTHLPLAVGFLASSVFVIFPSARKGIGEEGAWDDSNNANEATSSTAADDNNKKSRSPPPAPPAAPNPMTVGTAVVNLSKLLPTGTTLAFQTMAPSFTKGGDCSAHGVNYAFTWGLIVLLTSLCALLCFTDSVTDEAGHTCYGVATVGGFRFFDHLCEQELRLPDLEALKSKKKLRRRDFLHALTSAAVFLAIAFCDAGVQRCLVPSESTQWQQFLAILPLATSFLASFIFLIYPSARKGIGEEGAWVGFGVEEQKSTTTTSNDKQNQSSSHQVVVQAAAMGSSTRVAPSTSCEVELEPLV